MTREERLLDGHFRESVTTQTRGSWRGQVEPGARLGRLTFDVSLKVGGRPIRQRAARSRRERRSHDRHHRRRGQRRSAQRCPARPCNVPSGIAGVTWEATAPRGWRVTLTGRRRPHRPSRRAARDGARRAALTARERRRPALLVARRPGRRPPRRRLRGGTASSSSWKRRRRPARPRRHRIAGELVERAGGRALAPEADAVGLQGRDHLVRRADAPRREAAVYRDLLATAERRLGEAAMARCSASTAQASAIQRAGLLRPQRANAVVAAT